ncbi:hypothetical protein HK104_010148 [Borealophlyctis nickersoniae]|nr:hypothetical protein HK104_010148 [Borealophlyctis nickersoniae]
MGAQQEPPRRVLIIGGGIAGITFALALKRASATTGLNLEPVIFEASTAEDYAGSRDGSPHWLVWRWAVEVLLELGLGKRLSKIAWPVLGFKSMDADTNEVLVQWPPPEPTPGAVDPEIAAASAGSSLPPLVGLRKTDLLRLLLLALAGTHDDLIEGHDFAASGANNSDLSTDVPKGLEGDLAREGNWFEEEGFAELIGTDSLKLGHKLDSYIISATTGLVTARFANGAVETGFMMVGADGIDSTVRDLLGNSRYPPQYTGSVIAHGITRVHIPPVDTPTELEDRRPIPDFDLEDLYSFCPHGSALSIVGRGYAFGCANIGNGMLGWNVVASQPEPHSHVNNFTAARRRNTISAAIAARPRQSIVIGAQVPELSEVKTDSTSAEDKWNTPGATIVAEPEEIRQTSEGTDPLSAALSKTSISEPEAASPTSPTAPRRTRRGTSETAFERQLREQREEIYAQRTGLPSNILTPDTTLVGEDARTLALRLAQNLPLPLEAYSIIARTDASMTKVEDVEDNGHQALDSYTMPNFHPGRVMLIGDAAHPIATQAHGSVAGGLAITDGALLAKLIAKHLGPSMRAVNDESALENMSREFDRERAAACSAAVYEARAEGSWQRTENNWLRGLWRLSFKVTPTTWSKSAYETLLERGRVKEGYVSLRPVRT